MKEQRMMLVMLCALAVLSGVEQTAAAQTAVTVQTVVPADGTLRFQTTIDKKFVSKVYTLKKAKASEVMPLIQDILEPEGGTVNAVSIEGAEMLVISAPSYMTVGLDASIRTLDKKTTSSQADGTDEVYYRPKHRLPSELVELVTEVCASSVVTSVADDTNNVLYLCDTPDSLAGIKTALKEFDIPEAQEEIEVKIVEVNQGNNERIGLLWDAWKRALPESVDINYTNRDPVVGGKGGTWSVDFSTISPQALADFVNYMTRNGVAEVKTTTRINCVQRTAATITAGDVHRFFTGAQAVEEGPAKKLVTSVLDGVSVTLTPFIGAESIRLEVATTVNSMSGFDPNGLPVVNSRSVAATAVLTDGQVFALTGLERETTVDGEERVWGLGCIPFLGDWLFTTKTKVRQKSQLIVILKPRVLKHGGAGVRAPGK